MWNPFDQQRSNSIASYRPFRDSELKLWCLHMDSALVQLPLCPTDDDVLPQKCFTLAWREVCSQHNSSTQQLAGHSRDQWLFLVSWSIPAFPTTTSDLGHLHRRCGGASKASSTKENPFPSVADPDVQKTPWTEAEDTGLCCAPWFFTVQAWLTGRRRLLHFKGKYRFFP